VISGLSLSFNVILAILFTKLLVRVNKTTVIEMKKKQQRLSIILDLTRQFL